jgi:phage terminase large subunit
MEISLPYKFRPRPYQLPVLRALDNGAKRVVAVWHRRAGKEKTFLNYTAAATIDRVGSYCSTGAPNEAFSASSDAPS